MTTPQEYYELERRSRQALRQHSLSLHEWLICEKLCDLTFAKRRERVLVPHRNHLHWLTGIHRSDISSALGRLEGYRIIGRAAAPEFVSRDFQDPFWIWLLPDSQQWGGIAPRADREFAINVERELDWINEKAFVKAQAVMPEIVPVKMPGMSAEIAEVSREATLRERVTEEMAKRFGADAGQAVGIPDHAQSVKRLTASTETLMVNAHDVVGNPDDVGADVVGNPDNVEGWSSEIPTTSQPVYSRGRVRPHVRAPEHVHEHEHGTQSMVHDHGPDVVGIPDDVVQQGHEHVSQATRMEELQRMPLEELQRMLDDEATLALDLVMDLSGDRNGSYRKLWCLRLIDNRNPALKAIGELKMQKLEGRRFIKGPGQFANDVFKRMRDAARKVVTLLFL